MAPGRGLRRHHRRRRHADRRRHCDVPQRPGGRALDGRRRLLGHADLGVRRLPRTVGHGADPGLRAGGDDRGRHGGRRGAAGRMGDRGRGVDRRRPAALADTGASRPGGPRGRCLPVTRRVAARHRGGRGSRRARRGVRRGPRRDRSAAPRPAGHPLPARRTDPSRRRLPLPGRRAVLVDRAVPSPAGRGDPGGRARAALGHGRCAGNVRRRPPRRSAAGSRFARRGARCRPGRPVPRRRRGPGRGSPGRGGRGAGVPRVHPARRLLRRAVGDRRHARAAPPA